jgi:hypothetical protein
MKSNIRQFEWDGLIPVAFLVSMIALMIVSI